MAPVSQNPTPNSWSVIAIIFIALFVLLLFTCSLVIGYLYYQKKQRKNTNPYPYGSEDWLDFERVAASQVERDALVIANLDARVAVQEQYNREADRMIELLDRSQKHLTLQLRDEQRKSEPVNPEVLQRIYDDIHRPLEPPRPSLPPLAPKPSPTERPACPASPGAVASCPPTTQPTSLLAQSVVSSPSATPPGSLQQPVNQRTPVLLQTTKLRNIMRSNSRPGPARPVRFVEHSVKPSSVSLLDPAGFEDIGLSDGDEPVPTVGRKPSTFRLH
ncbi:hypothetical protein N0V93_008530 [Gnomoniopsis smithogilvyi]|uniref:Uncharacterized protein n=1 Tax=Gnomoniopsis smithogilvyi TaxID=1191159 RepID=A0A9W8YQH0_9PEZI|nr:hypothetical protein N0V93_008530 [Gnomoniopsis smithogilvyi]